MLLRFAIMFYQAKTVQEFVNVTHMENFYLIGVSVAVISYCFDTPSVQAM